MSKPVVILDAYWRRMEELFSAADLNRLRDQFEIVWAKNEPIPEAVLNEALPKAFAYVAAKPRVDESVIRRSPNLKVIAEVSGSFPDSINYEACAAAGIEVLCCAPGFKQSVAEMTLAMVLAGARGLIQEHELFRGGGEHWLEDNPLTDFTLYGCRLGFVGYGSIARETHRLLEPFQPQISVYDPWLPDSAAESSNVVKVELDELMSQNRCVIVTAAPTAENQGMINHQCLSQLPDGALLVLISRAHLADFEALEQELLSGRIRVALDVYPTEPYGKEENLRKLPNVIHSPHRAAAVNGGRHLIGKMLVDDLIKVLLSEKPASLQRAASMQAASLQGVGDANIVANMADERKTGQSAESVESSQ